MTNVTARAVRLAAKAVDAGGLVAEIRPIALRRALASDVLIEIHDRVELDRALKLLLLCSDA